MFNYYILVISGLTAGLFHGVNDVFIIIFAGILFITTLLFGWIDERNVQLLDASKDSLMNFEKRLIRDKGYTIFTNNENKKVEKKLGFDKTHTGCFKILRVVGIFISVSYLVAVLIKKHLLIDINFIC